MSATNFHTLQFKRGLRMLVHQDIPRISRLKFLTLHLSLALSEKKIHKLNGQPLLLMRPSDKLQNGSFQHEKSISCWFVSSL